MNDSEIFKLTSIMANTNIDSISFEFADKYCDIVLCIIKRRYRAHLPVQARASTSDEALKLALAMIEVVKPWDKVLKKPDLEKQRYEGGYYREMLDAEHEVEFCRHGNEYVINNINRKDSEGFYYSKEPRPVDPKKHTFVKDLPDGTQLYTWNDIGFLSGSAGELIVKDGLIIKSRMTAIS